MSRYLLGRTNIQPGLNGKKNRDKTMGLIGVVGCLGKNRGFFFKSRPRPHGDTQIPLVAGVQPCSF